MLGYLARIYCWAGVSCSRSSLVSSRSLIDWNDSLGNLLGQLLRNGLQEFSLALLLLFKSQLSFSFYFSVFSYISFILGLDLIQSENLAVLRFWLFLMLLGLARPDNLNYLSSSVSLGLYFIQGERYASYTVSSSTGYFQKCTTFDFLASDFGMLLLSEQMLLVWTGLLISTFSSSESTSNVF